MSIARWAGFAVMVALGLGASALQANCEWTMLGAREVDHRADHDKIELASSDQTFSAVRLHAVNAPVTVKKVVVHFGNGTDQVLDMQDEIQAGGKTRTIDLEGQWQDRHITSVEFWYKTAETGGQRAVVQLWGLS